MWWQVEKHLILTGLERVKVVSVNVIKVKLWLAHTVWSYEVYLLVIVRSNSLHWPCSFLRVILLQSLHVDLKLASLSILSALLHRLVVLQFLLAFIQFNFADFKFWWP